MDVYQNLFAQKRLSCLSSHGDFLPDFVEHFPDSAHVREACSRKHLFANHHMASWCGLNVENLIGVTSHEIFVEDTAHRKKHLRLEPIVISDEQYNSKQGCELENQVLLSRRSISVQRIVLKFNGLITYERLFKFPILDRSNKRVIAFLTFFIDLTHQLSLYKLLQFYKKYYSKQKAIHKLLKHLQLDNLFHPSDLPTFMEMKVLFACITDSRHKVIAQQLGCSVSTVSNHITHLSGKILNPFSLHNILTKLRTAWMEEQIEREIPSFNLSYARRTEQQPI